MDGNRRPCPPVDLVELHRNCIARPRFTSTRTIPSIRIIRSTPRFGGVGHQSLIRDSGKELLGSLASITADLIKFLRSKDLSVYSSLADAMESMADDVADPAFADISPLIPSIASLMIVSIHACAFLSEISQCELSFATSLVMRDIVVETPGRYTPLDAPTRPEQIILPDIRSLGDYATAPCKHECDVLT